MLSRLVSLALLAGLAGCGSVNVDADRDAGPADASGGDASQADANPDRVTRQWVVDRVLVPETAAEAEAYGLDIDGDPDQRPDNALGQVIATLAGQTGMSVQLTTDDAVRAGEIIHLLEVEAVDLADDPAAILWVFIGDNPSPPACTDPDNPATCGQHLNGDGSFDVAPGAPRDTDMAAGIAGGQLQAGPGDIAVDVVVFAGTAAIRLPLIGARAELDDVTGDTVSGKLGGAVTSEAVDGEVLPALADQMAVIVERDCQAPAPPCCTAGSTGETITSLFDADGDCRVTIDELRQNDLVNSLLAPDVDLLDANGNFDPGADGVADSLSVGVGITAVPATFAAP